MNWQIIEVSGRLDALTSNELETELNEAIEQGHHHLALDLSAVPYVSSAGLRVVLAGAKRVMQSGGLCLFAPRANVRAVLEMAGFHKIIKIHETAPEPVGA